jgi:hypothetical protein
MVVEVTGRAEPLMAVVGNRGVSRLSRASAGGAGPFLRAAPANRSARRGTEEGASVLGRPREEGGVAVRHGLAAGGRRRRGKEKGEKKRRERKKKKKRRKEREGRKKNRKRKGKEIIKRV